MASLVGAFCVPHIPLIASQPNVAPKRQMQVVMDTFARISARLQELRVDTAIIIGDDHYTVFGPHCLPSILIGIGDVDGPYEDWLKNPRGPIANNEPLANHILNHGFDNGFDWAFAKSLTIDHAVFVPWLKVVKGLPGVRTIPVYVSAGVTPLIRPRRCVDLGRMIRAAVDSFPGNDRVAIIGTGGLSHWVGMAEMGEVNQEWDHAVLDMISRGDIDGLCAMKDEDVLGQSGNGALEYRNWLVAVAAAGTYEMELLCYEPIHAWVAGTAMVELHLDRVTEPA
ncbi:MAG TPA: protocatechuate 3,4-dioxygenase [Novosphingobium sp.]|nr:protocatechuate 3,4-dioxygenase [Novosphingobium sp.]